MSLKNFVSETEIDEIRKRKQKEWEEKRTEEQPLERPEEPEDNRSLAERLHENKMKKDEEFAEKFKMKNMTYGGMDDDEFEHIENIENEKAEIYKMTQAKAVEAIKEFKSKQRKLPPSSVEARDALPSNVKAVKISAGSAGKNSKKKPSALQLLAQTIKRKPASASSAVVAPPKPTPSKPTGLGGLGLVGYGSDDDSDGDDDE
eukprot:m.112078 g.112078  ORF g.112078 m.112078 type:complete len:203 (-) comp28166_c0_seq1:420-1028(-)